MNQQTMKFLISKYFIKRFCVPKRNAEELAKGILSFRNEEIPKIIEDSYKEPFDFEDHWRRNNPNRNKQSDKTQ